MITPTHITESRKIRLVMELRTKGIHDTNVLGAIERVPREEFVLPAMQDQAYDDIALPIERGQTISQPFIVAKMTEALELDDRCKVLEIGTGSGYQACVLAKLSRRVYSIERHRPLLEGAQAIFDKLHIRNLTAICADGMRGWPTMNGIDQAPFDRIIITAAARDKPPSALMDQLVVGGIMVAPVGGQGEQVLKKYKRESEDTWSVSDICDVRFVPLLPDVATNGEAA
ncbi:MAG: protein-L-isoaspartate(D-aspartate) O-methyltransferase [Pseudomonadota bacterium]